MVSAGYSEGDATVNPTINAYLGTGVKVVLGDTTDNGLTVRAISHRAEADGNAKSAGGGVISAGLPQANATSNPTVKAYLDGSTTIKAGGSVVVDAESNSEPSGPVPTNYLTGDTAGSGSSPDTSSTDNSVTFPTHSLVTGDEVLYVANGNPVIAGLQSPHLYNVIVVDRNNLRFGDTFKGATVDAFDLSQAVVGVDTNRAMLRFASPHNLSTGDAVIYRIGAGGSSISSDFVDGQVLWVRVINPNVIELYTTQSAATSGSDPFGASSLTGSTEISNSDSNLQTGTRVTYLAPDPLVFNYTAVDVNESNGKPTGSNGGAYNLDLGYVTTPGNPPTINGHGLTEGQAVVYESNGTPSQDVGNLTNGSTYYVNVVDAWTINLANSYCEAVGYGNDSSCVDTSTNPIGQNFIPITAPSANNVTYAIVPAPMGGLTNGDTYQVHRIDGSNIALQAVGTSTDITLDPTAVDPTSLNSYPVIFGGDAHDSNQELFLAGSALQAASGAQQVYEQLGSLSGSTQELLAPDGSSLRAAAPPLGDGVTCARPHTVAAVAV